MSRPEKDIRVLVVDDSSLVREMICDILSSEAGIKVAGEAADGAQAIARIAELKPDIVTMDIEMPVMGGLEAIEKIIADCPTPILVVTALTGVRTAFAAVSKGALDVIEKPDITPENAKKLVQKIRLLARVDVTAHLQSIRGHNCSSAKKQPAFRSQTTGEKVVAIAASTGGPQAIHFILSNLPAGFPAPIVISQHIAEGFTQGMVDWLNSSTPLSVKVAANGDRLSAGNVYVNPAEHSMRITAQGMIILGEKIAGTLYNPSCNTMLASVASAYHGSAIGLILSGMGDDGATGIMAIKKAGGATLAQDAISSVVFGMNRIAVEQGGVSRALPLADIPVELMRLAAAR